MLSLQKKIIFIYGKQPKIDRSCDFSDAVKSLHKLGFITGSLYITKRNIHQVLDMLRNKNTLVWPATYTITDSPESMFLIDMLHKADINYVGPSVSSIRANSKIYLSQVLQRFGLPTLKTVIVSKYQINYTSISKIISSHGLHFPLLIKPEYSAGSHGVVVIENKKKLLDVNYDNITSYKENIILQEWCRMKEYTCAVIGQGQKTIIAPLEVVLSDNQIILDEETKRTYNGLGLKNVDKASTASINQIITRFWQALGSGDYARIDLVEDYKGRFYIIDVNFLPALDHNKQIVSFFPLALQKNYGWSYEESLLAILAASFLRNNISMPSSVKAVVSKIK